jgi:hypothetical protein
MKLLKNTLIASALALSVSAPASAVVLNIQNNILMGATGVDVGGTLYDVSFIDGILSENISAFTTKSGAEAASEALLNQVFTADSAVDSFTIPTNGCTTVLFCSTFTPYTAVATDGSMQFTPAAFKGRMSSFLGSGYNEPSYSTSNSPMDNIAVWKLSAVATTAAVPEPETYAMFLAGLGLMGFASRRKLAK